MILKWVNVKSQNPKHRDTEYTQDSTNLLGCLSWTNENLRLVNWTEKGEKTWLYLWIFKAASLYDVTQSAATHLHIL